jgi:hypothetical protein
MKDLHTLAIENKLGIESLMTNPPKVIAYYATPEQLESFLNAAIRERSADLILYTRQLKSTFFVNMIKLHQDKSNAEIEAGIDKVCPIPDSIKPLLEDR